MATGLIGKKIKYRYENGWEYHVHYESDERVSYTVVSGPFGSRKASQVTRTREVAPDVYMVGWYEETGTILPVSLVFPLPSHKSRSLLPMMERICRVTCDRITEMYPSWSEIVMLFRLHRVRITRK